MSVRFFVELKGTRQSVAVTPMSPLSAVLEKYCLQSKDKLDPSSCELYYQKKKLDLSTPVRFANLPKDAKLEVVTDQQQQRLGLSERPKPQQPAQSVQQAESDQSTDLTDKQESTGPSSSVLPSGPQLSQQPATAQPVESRSASTSTIQNSSSPAAAALPAGLDREVSVFKREATLVPGSDPRAASDLPADFYDFTADDYQAVMSGWAKQKATAAGPLKTQKLRDQDERRKAEQFGPVPVRIHWPDGTILQAEFRAVEVLGALQRLVQQCAATDLPKWYLYVTPPKQALKDMGLNFFKAGLVPAANVYVGLESQHTGPFLKQHIADLEGPPPERSSNSKQSDVPTSDSRTSGVAGASEFLPSKAASGTGEKKVPKWMKLNK